MAFNQISLFDQGENSSINYGWLGTGAEVLVVEEPGWLDSIGKNYQQLYLQKAIRTQQQTELDVFQILRSQLTQLTKA